MSCNTHILGVLASEVYIAQNSALFLNTSVHFVSQKKFNAIIFAIYHLDCASILMIFILDC